RGSRIQGDQGASAQRRRTQEGSATGPEAWERKSTAEAVLRCPRRRAVLLPPPTLRKGRHRGLARFGIAVGRCAILVMPKGERPKPRRVKRRGCRLHDPADDDAIGKHIEIILFPLA